MFTVIYNEKPVEVYQVFSYTYRADSWVDGSRREIVETKYSFLIYDWEKEKWQTIPAEKCIPWIEGK